MPPPARKVHFKISVLFLLIFLFSFRLDLAKSTAATNIVVINEVLYDPSGSDPGHEWIELYNSGDLPVDIAGYTLSVSSKNYQFPPFTLEAKSFVVVNWRTDGLDNKTNLYTGVANFETMGNAHGSVALFNSAEKNKNTIVDYVAYGDAGQTWGNSAAVPADLWVADDFVPGVSAGSSIGLKSDGADNHTSADWQSFATPTFNLANNMPVTYPSGIYLWEYLPYPEAGNEWVEVYNDNDASKTLTSWQIDDLKDGGSSPKTFSVTVAGKGYAKIELAASFFNNDGDSVRLLRPDGTVAEETTFTMSYKGNAFAKDSARVWQETTKPTLGEANVIESSVHETTVKEIKNLTIGSRVSLTADATVPPDLLGDNDFYVHDESGGIKIHCSCQLSSADFNLGDKVKISSSLEQSDEEKYIKTDAVEIVAKNLSQVAADEIKTGEVTENHEGNLVKLTGLYESSSGNTFYINDGTGSSKIYIKDSTGIIKPKMGGGDLVRVLGLVSQSGYLKDGSPNYRVLPRYQGDIEILNDTPSSTTTGSVGTGAVLGAVSVLPRTGTGQDAPGVFFFLFFSGLNLKLFLRGKQELD